MIRLFPGMAYLVYAFLFHARHEGLSKQKLLAHVGTLASSQDEQEAKTASAFLRLLQNVPEEVELNDLLEVLEQGLLSEGHSSNEDLIDTIINTLQLPYVSNRISGGNVDRLRRAILLPSERLQLKERLKEAFCNNCNTLLSNNEAVVFMLGEYGPILRCLRCATPGIVPCKTCTTGYTIPKIHSGTCISCQMTKQERSQDLPTPQPATPPRWEIRPPETLAPPARPETRAQRRHRLRNEGMGVVGGDLAPVARQGEGEGVDHGPVRTEG